MIYQNSLIQDQYQQIMDMFSNYLYDTVSVINSVKSSIYDILHIQLHSTQVLVQPNIPSVSANCKKTLDDLKRISSILRGYSKSKNVQRQDQQIRRSRVQNYSLSRQSRSKHSPISKKSGSSDNASRFKKPQPSSAHREQISMVTFQAPNTQNELQYTSEQGYQSKLKNYSSLRSLNRTVQLPDVKRLNTECGEAEMDTRSNQRNNGPLFVQQGLNSTSRKRSKTLEEDNCENKSISLVVSQTETKFKECLERHESGMNQIIKRNSQCLEMLKDIHKGLKSKKQKKQKKSKSKTSKNIVKNQPRKYQAMTPSMKRKDQITAN